MQTIEISGPGVDFYGPSVDFFGLEGALSDDEAKALGKSLASKSNASWERLTASELSTILGQYDASSRQKIIAAYTTNGGDTATLNVAIGYLEKTITPSGFDTTRNYYIMGMSVPKTAALVWGGLATLSACASAFHGYRRNNSLGWGIGWFILGSIFPVITPTIALAQGFGKPAR